MQGFKKFRFNFDRNNIRILLRVRTSNLKLGWSHLQLYTIHFLHSTYRHRENNGETFESAYIDEITNHPAYDRKNLTTLYIHGYIENQMSDTVVKMKRAYAKRGNNNFITLNWSVGASGPLYPVAVRNVYRVGKT